MNMKFNKMITRMFSDPEFEKKVNDKVDEAMENGSSTLEDDGEKLQFADAGDGQVIVEDKINDEATIITDNEDGTREIKELESEDVKTESDTQPDVVIDKIEGKDGDAVTDTVPEVKVEVSTGITDPEKAGLKSFSLTFKNTDVKSVAKYAKVFSDMMTSMEDNDSKEITEVQKDTEEAMVDQGKRAAKLADTPFPEKTYSDEELMEAQNIVEDAKKLQDDVEEVKESKDQAKIDECKKMSKSIISRANKLYSKGHDVTSLMSKIITFSDELDELSEVKPEEVKTEVAEPKGEVKEVKDEKSTKVSNTPVEETKDVKSESEQKHFSACLHTSFDDCSVKPIIESNENKLFSESSVKDSINKVNNPYLYTKFE